MKKLTAFLLIAMMLVPATAFAGGKRHRFFSKQNIGLFLADAAARSADGWTTRNAMTNPCHCLGEVILPQSFVSSNGRMAATEAGFLGITIGVTYMVHRLGWHRVEFIVPAADATVIARAAYLNAGLHGPRTGMNTTNPVSPIHPISKEVEGGK